MNLEASSNVMMRKMESSGSNLEKTVHTDDNSIKITISPQLMKSNTSSPSSTAAACNMHEKLLVKKYLKFKESGEPSRVMYYKEDGSWVDYPNEVVDLVRRGFLEKNPVLEVDFRGSRSILDFLSMLEIEFDSGKGRSISWIDVNGKCFFPSVFVNSCEKCSNLGKVEDDKVDFGSNFPNIEMDLKFCKKRKDSENITEIEGLGMENYAECTNNPRNRGQNLRHMMSMPRWPNTRILKEGEKGQRDISNEKFLLSAIRSVEPDATITQIHQCVTDGASQKAKFEVFINHLQVIKKRRGDPNVVFAWHGTSAKGIESILAHGFEIWSQIQFPQAYGVGVHFSPVKVPHHSAMLSEVDNNGQKHMILCRVILGKCEKVEAGSQQKFPSSNDFDSGVDDLENPRLYVVWPCNISTCILPEVVVSYNPGSTSRVLSSKFRRFLPPAKLTELRALCSSVHEGRMRTDEFARLWRSLVGDKLLQLVIREIRGRE